MTGRDSTYGIAGMLLGLFICSKPARNGIDVLMHDGIRRFVCLLHRSLRKPLKSRASLCRLLDIRPRDARDLSRVLRIVARSTDVSTQGAALLDISDERTLDHLLARARLLTATGCISMRQVLQRQPFVPLHNGGMIRLAELVGDR